MSVVTSGGPSGSVADPELLRARVVHARRENAQRRKLDIMKKGLLHKPLAVPRLLHDFSTSTFRHESQVSSRVRLRVDPAKLKWNGIGSESNMPPESSSFNGTHNVFGRCTVIFQRTTFELSHSISHH